MSDFTPDEVRFLKALCVGSLHSAGPEVASVEDLHDKYGDPEIKFNPRGWKGPSMEGCHYSQCRPDYLLMLARELERGVELELKKPEAERKMYTPKVEQGKPQKPPVPIWTYRKKDAALARGWAREVAGANGPIAAGPPRAAEEPVADDPIPFVFDETLISGSRLPRRDRWLRW